MLNQHLKDAFIALAEKCAAPNKLAALLRTNYPPEMWAAYNSNSTDVVQIVNEADWSALAYSAARQPELEVALMLAVLMMRLAFVAPEEIFDTMDGLSLGWLAGVTSTTPPIQAKKVGDKPLQRSIPTALQKLFWRQVEGSENIVDAVYQFPTTYDPALIQAYTTTMLQHPGTATAFEENYLHGPLQMRDLQDYPEGSLGYTFYHQITDNGLDPEILKDKHLWAKKGSLLYYVNQRTLQTHDIWHCLTSYTTDPIDEFALQAFQMAQLGNPFSPALMAVILTQVVFFEPASLRPVMQAIATGWQQGRTTPPFLPIHWEQHWGQSINDLRQEYHIKTQSLKQN